LRVQAGKQSVLITGDIEAKSEKKIILREREKIKSNILIVPHHGSQTSSCPEFIEAVSPIYAIIPVGYKNQYGHPKQNIVDRYKQANIKVLNTIHDGAVTFILEDTELLSQPQRYRMDKRKYWSEF
jgi:competence protein ComEC